MWSEASPGPRSTPPEFRFCEVPVAVDDQEAWCAFVADLPEDRCPGLRALCTSGIEGEERVASGCDQRDPTTPEFQDPYSSNPPVLYRWSDDAVQELIRWTAAFLVAALVFVLLRAFWLTFGRGRARRDAGADDPVLASVGTTDDLGHYALPDTPALDAPGLIARAEEAYAAGSWGEAAWLARGAALKHLHREQRLVLHRSRTDREYLRAVREDSELARELRVVVDAAEQHRWGAVKVASDLANRALASARRLLDLAGAMLLVGGLLGAGSARAQSDRFGPDGDAALARVLTLHGFDAGYRLVSLERIDEGTDVLFLDLTELSPAHAQWEGLREWVSGGGILVLAGDAARGFGELGERVLLDPGARLVARGPLLGSDTPLPRWPDGPQYGFTEGRAWVSAEDGLGNRAAVISEIVFGFGAVVAIGDARLFDNLAFVHPDNEAFVGDLLYLGQAHLGWPLPTPARVRLVTRAAMSTDLPQNNPLTSVANARLLPFVLQLLVAWTLLSLWRGWPFVRARPVPARDRLTFGEHVTALGTRWYRLGASGHALREVAQLWLARLGPSGLRRAAVRAGYSEPEAGVFVGWVTAVAEAESPQPADDDLERMEEIWTITRQST